MLAANFIDDGVKTWILDWEYSASGNTFFDLANFAVNNQLDERQCETVLNVYFGGVHESQLAHLKLLMIASDLREAFWSFVQIAISNLDFDYREYAERHFARYLEATRDIDKWRRML